MCETKFSFRYLLLRSGLSFQQQHQHQDCTSEMKSNCRVHDKETKRIELRESKFFFAILLFHIFIYFLMPHIIRLAYFYLKTTRNNENNTNNKLNIETSILEKNFQRLKVGF